MNNKEIVHVGSDEELYQVVEELAGCGEDVDLVVVAPDGTCMVFEFFDKTKSGPDGNLNFLYRTIHNPDLIGTNAEAAAVIRNYLDERDISYFLEKYYSPEIADRFDGVDSNGDPINIVTPLEFLPLI